MSGPRIFIASSSEGLHYANAAFSQLEKVGEPIVWDQDLFRPSESTLEGLDTILGMVDYGLVVCTPDDLRIMHAKGGTIPRDNVVFELGMLMGRLGRRNVFILAPAEEPGFLLPSDLKGINYLKYQRRTDNNYVASVATAARRISEVVRGDNAEICKAPTHVAFWNNVHERSQEKCDLRSLVQTSTRYVFLSGIALNYVVQSCRQQMISTLNAGTTVEVLIPTLSAANSKRYTPFKSDALDEMRLALSRWSKFSASLEEEAAGRFRLFATDLHLTHSVGIYDELMYVNPYCAGLDSADLPSFRLDRSIPAFGSYLSDLAYHIQAAKLIAGDAATPYIIQLADDWRKNAHP
jgi:Predicted nucleotide-binding protein containing TIR-like domain